MTTKEEIRELTGEDPEDLFGPDWRNIIEDLEGYKIEEDKK